MNEIDRNVADMQNMLQRLMEISISNTEEMKKDIKFMGDKVDSVTKRMDDFENHAEVTTQQRNTIRRTVNAQVYKLLGLPEKKYDWNEDDKLTAKKYSQIFHQRCYAEVSRQGHLSQPYGTTTAMNFIHALKDIEGWSPSNGISGLKSEADENARATLKAREQGYL